MHLRFEGFRIHVSGKRKLYARSGINIRGVGPRCAQNYRRRRRGLERKLQRL